MPRSIPVPSPEREALVQWVASLGAVTVEALALRLDVSPASARGRLHAASRAGLLAVHRVGPVLFTVTPAGLRACCQPGLDVCRVSPASARHLAVCARVAAALERCYPECSVLGERPLRLQERGVGALASARVGLTPGGEPALHRPDLVLWPLHSELGLPVAVEVELTVKAPARLLEILSRVGACPVCRRRPLSGPARGSPRGAARRRAGPRAGAGSGARVRCRSEAGGLTRCVGRPLGGCPARLAAIGLGAPRGAGHRSRCPARLAAIGLGAPCIGATGLGARPRRLVPRARRLPSPGWSIH